MKPDEVEALKKAHALWNRGLLAIALSTLIILITIPIMGSQQPGILEHVLGQSTQQTATVTNIDKVDFCTRSNRDQITLTWEEDSTQRSEVVERCGDPWDIGDEVTIWSTSGMPQTQGPWTLRIVAIVLVVGITAATLAVLHARRKVKNQAQSAIDGTWKPISLPTTGLPDKPNFVVNPLSPIKTRKPGFHIRIYRSRRKRQSDPNIPGTLYVTEVKKNKARGLSLHVTENDNREWAWQG